MIEKMGIARIKFNNKLGSKIKFNTFSRGIVTPVRNRAAKDNSKTTSVPQNVAANMDKNGAFQMRRFNNLAITTQIKYAAIYVPKGKAV